MSDCDTAPAFIGPEIEEINGPLTREEGLGLQWVVEQQLPPGAKIVELGSFQGRSSITIASALAANGILYCVDYFSWSWDVLRTFMNNIKKFRVANKIRMLIMGNDEAAREFADESLQMVFINANNNCESVKQDILQWGPKIKSGGLLVCHRCPRYPAVGKAIEALQMKGGLISGSLWCTQKK